MGITVPPEPQEFEISVFGPGYGECVVLHLGEGQWGVVDSCLDPITKRPAALHYLESLGQDVESSVRFIIATHWHDDHMQGISKVFHQTKAAVFSCTEVVQERDFIEVLGAWGESHSLPGGSGIDELHGILAELNNRQPGTRYPSPRRASANKVLWERSMQPSVKVKALSPSDAAVMTAIAQLQRASPDFSKVRRRLPNLKPNDASVVLSVQVGTYHVLLGSDLEVRTDRGLGWLAIVDEIEMEAKSHQVFKAAHHGSPNGDSDEVWEQMLIPQPWVATTPFVSGNVQLPSVNDCRRILNRTSNAYLTAPPHPVKFHDPNRAVERTVHEATLSSQIVPGKYGLVRLRKRINEPSAAAWQVELFGHAMSMDNYVKATH